MFTLGELVLIELSLIREAKELDLSMQVGQQFMEIIGKCERGIAKLQAAANKTAPLNLGPPTADPKV